MATTNSVNVPTNQKIKEKDINTKLQLYGIFEAFAQGKVPSNKQIDVAMNSALEWRGMKSPSKKLSSEGQHLIADLRDVIEKTKIMLLTKNDGNLLQDFIWQTQSVGHNGVQKPGMPVDKDTARQHGNQAVEGLRTLGTLIITNGQFRKLLNDFTVLLRDIAGDAAQKAANQVNPSEDELQQIDRPAEDNTWHEKPDFKSMKQEYQQKLPLGKKDIQDAAAQAGGDAAQQANPQGSRDPADTAQLAAREQQDGAQTGVDPKTGAKQGAQNFKNNLNSRFDDEQKEKMRKYRERTNNYFKDKVPKDRREQTIFRLKKMVVEIQSHSDYQQAIDTLLRLAEEYSGHGKNLANSGSQTAKGAHDQDSLKTAETDLRELLERFANSTSFDDLFDSINTIYEDANRDPELKNWFREMNRYIRRCLQEQGYILEDASNEDWNRLYDQGHFLLRDRYRNHTDRILDEFKFIGHQFDEDKENKAFARSMEKLFQDLGNDQDGKPTFKPHLIKDLTEVLIPAFFEHVRYIPIPRIEYSDSMVDAVIENLVIEGDNLAPNMMEFGSDNYWKWGRKGVQGKNKNKVMMSVSGVQMDLRDVAFYVKKKEGFPSITDKGVMDIFLGGTGLSFKVGMETADKSDRSHFFKINSVTVDIKNMDIKMKQSNHKLLFGLFKPILFKVMRPVIQKVVEKQIRDNFAKLDAMMYRVKQETDRAQEEAKSTNDPEQKANIYQRYFNAWQREIQKQKEEKEAKAKEVASDKKVNVAITQQDSMFKNISLPGGISTKATEYRQLAEKGDKWESPVFSIGSAKESSNLPAPSRPQRKPHSTTEATLKGQSNGHSLGNNQNQFPGSGAGNFGNSQNNFSNGQNNFGNGQNNYGGNQGGAQGGAGGLTYA
jgi:hypothetical protein